MKNIQPSEFNEASDTVQFLENTRARVTKTYFFYEGEWYEDPVAWNNGDEDTFDVFQGFLANFSAKDVVFSSSGKVLDKPIQIDCATDQLQYVMIGNPTPVDITMKDIEVVSFNEASDTLQLLDNARARVVKTYFAYEGDWYENPADWNVASDDVFYANTSMLSNFSAKDVVLNFPSAL